jgi:hypothetical protein
MSLQQKLVNLVKSKSLSKSEYQAISYQLSEQQSRLFLYLIEHGTSNTITLTRKLSIGNLSATATHLNKRLVRCNDPRMVVCLCQSHTNKFGQRGVLGQWSIVSSTASNDNS